MDYFDWECSPAATNVASSWSNQLHQMGDSSLIESFHENLNQKSNHMVQKLAVTGSTDSPNNAAKFNYLWRQAAMKLAADSVLTKSGSSAETSSSAEFFSSAKRAHTIDPSTNGLISDLVMSELDYPQYIDDKATISTKTGSLESLDCLLSATNRNTNTSVQDDINSVLFSDGKKFWNLSSISALDSETNTANIKSNYCSSLTNKTTSQCSPKRSNQCIGIISEPKLKKSRLEKLLSSSNINFQQADNSSECTDCTEDHDSKTIVEMKEMLYRAAAFRPVNIEKMESVEKPKRKNVKISSDPQTVAARQRREKISEKIRVLQRLVPAGNKMDTASVLDEAANYLKFLRSQVKALESVGHKFDFVNCPISPMLYPFPHHSLLPFNHSFPMQTNHEFSFPKPRSS